MHLRIKLLKNSLFLNNSWWRGQQIYLGNDLRFVDDVLKNNSLTIIFWPLKTS